MLKVRTFQRNIDFKRTGDQTKSGFLPVTLSWGLYEATQPAMSTCMIKKAYFMINRMAVKKCQSMP